MNSGWLLLLVVPSALMIKSNYKKRDAVQILQTAGKKYDFFLHNERRG
jgi:hypothetical protein